MNRMISLGSGGQNRNAAREFEKELDSELCTYVQLYIHSSE